MLHMTYRLSAAMEVGLINEHSSRVSVAAAIGGNAEAVDFCMAWLAVNGYTSREFELHDASFKRLAPEEKISPELAEYRYFDAATARMTLER